MIARSSLGIAILAAGLLASGAAFASPYTGPTVTVDGVNLPVAPSVMDTETSFEQVVTGTGQGFSGVFEVNNIGVAGNNSYTSGENGVYLYGEFTGFTVQTLVPPTATTPGTVLLSGGQIDYYVSTSDIFTASSGSQSTDLSTDDLGTLFLSATPEAIDNNGDTLELTLPEGTTTTDFAQATATAFLDTTGGAAAYNFSDCSQTNAFTGACADISFQGTANTTAQGSDFPVSGSNDITASVVPEPLTLSLFGAGLVGAAAMRRRKKKSA